MTNVDPSPPPRPNHEVRTTPPEPYILIIGAGITGLVLAQALKKHGIAFTVFERDPDVSARGRGWGLTIHWSLDTFISLLPQHIVDRLPETYVDPETSKRGENGSFLFFNLRNGETRWKVPPNKRIRVSRERLRSLLLEGLEVQVCGNLTLPPDMFEHATDDNDHVVLHSGPETSSQSLLPLRIRSLLTSQTTPQLPAHCLLEPMAQGQESARVYSHTTLNSQSTMSCLCDCSAPASSTLRNLLSRCGLSIPSSSRVGIQSRMLSCGFPSWIPLQTTRERIAIPMNVRSWSAGHTGKVSEAPTSPWIYPQVTRTEST